MTYLNVVQAVQVLSLVVVAYHAWRAANRPAAFTG